jgi:hypothetical protein
MSMQRRKFSKEFKIQIIREIDNGTPVAQLSRQHQFRFIMIVKELRMDNEPPYFGLFLVLILGVTIVSSTLVRLTTRRTC